MKQVVFIVVLLGSCAFLQAQAGEDLETKSRVAFSPHNLSLTEIPLSADSLLTEFSLCRFCHVPRKASAVDPLWYHEGAVRTYDLERELPVTDQHVHPLDPSSRKCLYCHDGSLAPSFPHRQTEIPQQVNLSAPEMAAPPHYNTHLFNFPVSGMEITRPDSNSALRADGERVTCLTCHNPHDNSQGKFLRVTREGSAICMECHQMQNWDQSVHGNPEDPLYAEMKEVACLQCHEIHTLPVHNKLLRADENSLCLSCHDAQSNGAGETASKGNLVESFEKPFTHPIRFNPNVEESGYTGAGGDEHLDVEFSSDRYVRCGDCHNPHAASEHAVNPQLGGALLFADGVDALGFPKRVVDAEFEVCYKCHGRTQNALPGQDVGRLLATGNTSFHPVESVGNNSHVPSLKPAWSEQSIITCSDCHGNDDVMGPQGPHGSNIPHILKKSWVDSPFSTINENTVCATCHDLRQVASGAGFRFHSLHIEKAGYGCAACHNPHGSVDSPGLMDLSRPHIQPVNGLLEVSSIGPGHGSCTLQCHGKVHAGQTY